jgi:hypothetical protein
MADWFQSRRSSPPFGAHGFLAGRPCGCLRAAKNPPTRAIRLAVPQDLFLHNLLQAAGKTKSAKAIQNTTTSSPLVSWKDTAQSTWQYLRTVDSGRRYWDLSVSRVAPKLPSIVSGHECIRGRHRSGREVVQYGSKATPFSPR